MRTVKALLAAGLLTGGLPSLAYAQWYVGADIGANYAADAKVTDTTPYTKTKSDWSTVSLGEVGYSFGAPKVEFEVGARNNGAAKVNGVHEGSGATKSLSLMFNGIYDLLPTGSWHPFLGAGIGAAHVAGNDITAPGQQQYSGHDWEFAYQGIAGIGYDFATNLMLKAQYRYFATLDYPVSGPKGATGNSGYGNHSILVGLTFKFGEAPVPAPAPAAEAAPAPVAKQLPPPPPPAPVQPAQHTKNFMVFFDFNKATITAQAATIIQEAAAAAQAGGVTRVSVTGHTDLAGSDKYNMALSTKRADAVRDALVRQGVPASEITVLAKGKSDPLFPTKDGVREPQNRRVEIVLQ